MHLYICSRYKKADHIFKIKIVDVHHNICPYVAYITNNRDPDQTAPLEHSDLGP